MRKYLLLTICFFTSISLFAQFSPRQQRNVTPSLQTQYNKGYFLLQSADNKLTVIGVSNIMTKRQDEITSAKENAAKIVAMYYGVSGSIESINRAGSNFFDFEHDTRHELNYTANYESYIANLTFDPEKDVLRTNEGIFVRFQYGADVPNINYTARLQSGRPTWTSNQNKPVVDGYVVTVGFARNHQRLKDTIFKSVENAILTMISDLHTTVNTREASEIGSSSSSFIQTRSEGRINNFQVIEIWIEPLSRSVYTLAVARNE